MVTIIKRGSDKAIIKAIMKQDGKPKSRKKADISKFCGILHLNEDPLILQKKWRDEW